MELNVWVSEVNGKYQLCSSAAKPNSQQYLSITIDKFEDTDYYKLNSKEYQNDCVQLISDLTQSNIIGYSINTLIEVVGTLIARYCNRFSKLPFENTNKFYYDMYSTYFQLPNIDFDIDKCRNYLVERLNCFSEYNRHVIGWQIILEHNKFYNNIFYQFYEEDNKHQLYLCIINNNGSDEKPNGIDKIRWNNCLDHEITSIREELVDLLNERIKPSTWNNQVKETIIKDFDYYFSDNKQKLYVKYNNRYISGLSSSDSIGGDEFKAQDYKELVDHLDDYSVFLFCEIS